MSWSGGDRGFTRALGLVFLLAIACTPLKPAALCAQPAADAVRLDRPAVVDAPAKPKTPTSDYYVEFRVAEIGLYGHSYAVYGTVGGKPNYADLHPMGNYAIMALGHILPVPANTEWDPDVLKLPVASRYRHQLTAEQYQKLVAAVHSAQANKAAYWNAVTNNCNHFIGVLAEAVGLRVPGQFQVSYAFVPALKKLNEGSNATGATAHKRRLPPSPQT